MNSNVPSNNPEACAQQYRPAVTKQLHPGPEGLDNTRCLKKIWHEKLVSPSFHHKVTFNLEISKTTKPSPFPPPQGWRWIPDEWYLTCYPGWPAGYSPTTCGRVEASMSSMMVPFSMHFLSSNRLCKDSVATWGLLQRSPPFSTFSSNLIHLKAPKTQVSEVHLKWWMQGLHADVANATHNADNLIN